MIVQITDRYITEYKNVKSYAFDLGLISEVKNYRPPLDE